MYNINVVVKPDETVNDIIEQICLSENINCDDHFAFSAIMRKSKTHEDCNELKINCLEVKESNPFTPVSLITSLYDCPPKHNDVRYVMVPLEQYLTVFRPMLNKMVNRAYPFYKKLIPDKEDMMSILSLKIVELSNKGYYLHNYLIYKTFINALNMEVRKLKKFDMRSLDAPIGHEEGKIITLYDTLPCPIESEKARLRVECTEDLYENLKQAMLKDMSQFAFDRILIQLKSRTVDVNTSRILSKYRDIFNPDFIPRPNSRGVNK